MFTPEIKSYFSNVQHFIKTLRKYTENLEKSPFSPYGRERMVYLKKETENMSIIPCYYTDCTYGNL